MPNYLKTNHITKQRQQAITDKKEEKKHLKKTTDWTPSTKYQSPPTNKIPKETSKAIELRMVLEKEKEKDRYYGSVGGEE